MDVNDQMLEDLQRFFKVLGDPTRLRIIFLLKNSDERVNDIATKLNMEQSAISHQLKNLYVNRVVSFKRVGKEKIYSLLDSHITKIIMNAYEHIKE